MVSGIYKITNRVNGKFYIGSAVDCSHRWRGQYNRYLTNAFKKHGKENFSFDVIEEVPDISLLLEREQYYLDELKPWNREIGYNIALVAGNCLGVKASEETKKKMSLARKGEKHWNYGNHWSDEIRKKMSESSTGIRHTNETKEKISKATKGSNNASARLTEEQVKEIRSLYKPHQITIKTLAKWFDVGVGTIKHIIQRQTWKLTKPFHQTVLSSDCATYR